MTTTTDRSTMLVLTRKTDQAIVITTPDGHRTTVTVASITGEKVRLGITAHRDVLIHREEVQEQVDAMPRSAQKRKEGAR